MGNAYDINGTPLFSEKNPSWDRTVKGIAHRGYSAVAPENTLPAYKLAKKMGFTYVETDISFTSDGVAVCLHDASINRTSNGTGNIGSLTWAQVQTYDFGSWKSSAYAGTKIPSFEQFIKLCRDLGLHPYIELKDTATYTEAQIQGLVDIVAANGMQGKVTWISFSATYLGYIKDYDSAARLGYLASSVSSAVITTTQAMKTTDNEVFVDTADTSGTAATLCKNAGLPMEVWTIDSAVGIKGLDPYTTGVTSNELIAGEALYEANIE